MDKEILEFAKSIALETGQLLKEKWEHSSLKLSSKGFRDIVTDADFASQKLLTDAILKRYPSHGFLSEEEDSSLPTTGDVIWIIDPIDGTSNFSRKSPLFSVSIAAAHPPSDDGTVEIFAGVVLDPLRHEMFYAAKGGGAWLNNKKIQVSSVTAVSDSIASLDWPRDPVEREQILSLLPTIVHATKTTRSLGTAALALSYIACGRLDAYFHMNLQPWDVAAAALIITEAGGAFSTFQGSPWKLGDKSALGTNHHLHQAYIDLIQNNLNK
ncbi:MAG: myo-inositol-1(or 4)-monophosphatase [Cellvibrionaceae bacterium]|jgi:myo-inositol-1(or 4)-monophosphatase